MCHEQKATRRVLVSGRTLPGNTPQEAVGDTVEGLLNQVEKRPPPMDDRKVGLDQGFPVSRQTLGVTRGYKTNCIAAR